MTSDFKSGTAPKGTFNQVLDWAEGWRCHGWDETRRSPRTHQRVLSEDRETKVGERDVEGVRFAPGTRS